MTEIVRKMLAIYEMQFAVENEKYLVLVPQSIATYSDNRHSVFVSYGKCAGMERG